jgi:hypothetical protein
MERLGADVVSSSLGYGQYDPPGPTYTLQQMDGQTTKISKAAAIAARKGVLLVTAMGNQPFGPRRPDGTAAVNAPADADSIVSVGATNSNGIWASFSITGPTGDGRIKPEVVAQGVSVTAVSGQSGYTTGFAGTSASTPLVAGAAALVFSAHPELTPLQVRKALMQTAQRINDGGRTATWPNNFYGYGMINALEAVLYHGMAFSNRPFVLQSGNQLTISVSIASKTPLVGDSLFLYYRSTPSGPFVRVRINPASRPNSYSATIPAPTGGVFPQAYFSARDNSGNVRTSPYNAPDSLFVLQPDSIQTGVPSTLIPDRFILHPNYPNPFSAGGGSAFGGNPATVIHFDAPTAEDVELGVYNVLGQRVKTLFVGTSITGANRFTWDGSADGGTPAATGVYLLRLKTPTAVLSKRMVYLR